MPKMFGAFAEVFREMNAGFFLENMSLARRDGVPKLGFAFVEEVDGREVEVLFVPAEHRFPGANVAIRRCDTPHLDVYGLTEQRVQRVEVPAAGPLVHQSVEEVCSVDGRGEDNIFPKLS